jgi:hypothetical protein
MGENGRRYVTEHLSRRVFVDRLEALLGTERSDAVQVQSG